MCFDVLIVAVIMLNRAHIFEMMCSSSAFFPRPAAVALFSDCSCSSWVVNYGTFQNYFVNLVTTARLPPPLTDRMAMRFAGGWLCPLSLGCAFSFAQGPLQLTYSATIIESVKLWKMWRRNQWISWPKKLCGKIFQWIYHYNWTRNWMI